MSKKIYYSIFGLMLAAAVVYGTSNVLAEDETVYPSIVQRIAERFGVSEDEVEAVFDEERANRHAEMQTRFEERLDEAITEGSLTEEQKQLILDKHEELQAARQENMGLNRGMTPEERREQMATQKSELDSWANENGIDLDLFMNIGMGMKEGPRGEGRHFGGDFE